MAVQDAQDPNGGVRRSEVNGPSAVRQDFQARGKFVAWDTRKAAGCNPLHLANEVADKAGGCDGIIGGDIDEYADKVLIREGRVDQLFRFNCCIPRSMTESAKESAVVNVRYSPRSN